MVHTVRVYSYGMTVRVWYGFLYHMRIATIATITVYKQPIAIDNTVLLVILIIPMVQPAFCMQLCFCRSLICMEDRDHCMHGYSNHSVINSVAITRSA